MNHDRALVRVAVELRPEELQRLQEILERRFQRELDLKVELDPSILGGVWVRVGDIVIDGSLKGKLEALRHHLRAQARTMSSARVDLTTLRAESL
jgi:F-type H+-transporting ATPase subunit delta